LKEPTKKRGPYKKRLYTDEQKDIFALQESYRINRQHDPSQYYFATQVANLHAKYPYLEQYTYIGTRSTAMGYKLEFICPIHGKQEITYNRWLAGQGCLKCFIVIPTMIYILRPTQSKEQVAKIICELPGIYEMQESNKRGIWLDDEQYNVTETFNLHNARKVHQGLRERFMDTKRRKNFFPYPFNKQHQIRSYIKKHGIRV
jgi:hypothetical protein